MKKFIITFIVAFLMQIPPVQAQDTDISGKISGIGFKKRTELTPELQIKNIFNTYQKSANNHELEAFLSLHDESYRSSDGYNKERLKELAVESWKEYPDIRHSVKILNINVDIDNATVITQEQLSGTTKHQIELVKGNGHIDSESTAVYYLKKCSNDWKITADFVLSEKTSLRYGLAKFIPMSIDAPAIVSPDEEYTAVLKINTPRQYIALISINNEPITYPVQKSEEVFRAMKSTGLQERLLKSNNDDKNENAVASVGIAKPNLKDDNLSVNLLGIAFLSSRVNVIKHKTDNVLPINTDNGTKAENNESE